MPIGNVEVIPDCDCPWMVGTHFLHHQVQYGQRHFYRRIMMNRKIFAETERRDVSINEIDAVAGSSISTIAAVIIIALAIVGGYKAGSDAAHRDNAQDANRSNYGES